MKILLLITGLFFSGGLFANMDNRCSTMYWADGSHKNFIDRYCERNNILHLQSISKGSVIGVITRWCRQDRQINYLLNPATNEYDLVCVLYSKDPREKN